MSNSDGNAPAWRTGSGLDAHRLIDAGGVVLCGILVDETRGVDATSDGDVAAHALCDALLGAAALGDLGEHFPSGDPRWHGVDSLALLGAVTGMLAEAGWAPSSVDVTVIAETVRVAPHRAAMRERLATALGIDVSAVSVKATTTDGLGFTGTGEGIAATAVATVARIRPASR